MTSLLFYTTNGIISKVIRWMTGSKVSHTAIGTNIHGVPMVIHATVGGIKVQPRKKYEKYETLVAEYKFNTSTSDGLTNALKLIDENYDYPGLFGIGIVVLFRWIGVKIKNPLSSPKAMVCTEFVLHVDHLNRIKEWRGLDPEATTPQALLDICERSDNFTKV